MTVDQLRLSPKWVGLELSSSWLLDSTTAFVEQHVLDIDDDPLRPKDWLHLNIAYGDGDIDEAARIAADLDPSLEANWEITLWEQDADGSWDRLTRR